MKSREESPRVTTRCPSRSVALAWAFGVSALAALLSYFAPEEHASTLVGITFLSATALLCRNAPRAPSEFGLALGGLVEPAPLDQRRMLFETARALGQALLVGALVLPLFTIGYILWFAPSRSFDVHAAFGFGGPTAPFAVLDLMLAHLLVVALPEEAFFRGYLQSSLTPRSSPGLRSVILANLLTSAIFALGHYATDPNPSRLAVFFPSLLFGLIRTRTGGVGASIFFHTLANLTSAFLAAGFGFAR